MAVESSKQTIRRQRLDTLGSWLSITEPLDEQHHKIEGSCQWIEDRKDFQEWRGFLSESHSTSIYWLHANPGTGKSVLASHVRSSLKELNLDCSHFFFHTGNKSSNSLSQCLRSVAFQMALASDSICQSLVQMYEDGLSLNLDDVSLIWNRLFTKGIFQVRFRHLPLSFIASQ